MGKNQRLQRVVEVNNQWNNDTCDGVLVISWGFEKISEKNNFIHWRTNGNATRSILFSITFWRKAENLFICLSSLLFSLHFPLDFRWTVSFQNGEWWMVNDKYKGDDNNTDNNVLKSEGSNISTKGQPKRFCVVGFWTNNISDKASVFSCCLKQPREQRLLQLSAIEVISCRWGLFYPCNWFVNFLLQYLRLYGALKKKGKRCLWFFHVCGLFVYYSIVLV